MRKFIGIAASGAVIAMLGTAIAGHGTEVLAADEINFVSWGGSYTESQKKGYLEDYQQETGVKINIIDYNGGLAQIKAQIEAKNVTWDIVDIIPGDMIRGCDEGLLEEIDPSIIQKSDDGTPTKEDMLDGAGYHDCAIGNTVWSTVVAYDSSRIKGGTPTSIADFWNIAQFPGKRGMRKVAEVNFEWALMADGVPSNKVYEVLGTPDGMKRALASLDKIKEHVVWWEAGAQPPQLLADGEVVMTTAYNGRLYNAVKKEGKPFVLIWNTQIWDQGFMSIVKGSPNKEAALKLLGWYTNPKRMAKQTNFISYPPPRKSSMKYIPEDVQPHLPTYPANMEGSLKFNAEFWATYKDEYQERFIAWLAK